MSVNGIEVSMSVGLWGQTMEDRVEGRWESMGWS